MLLGEFGQQLLDLSLDGVESFLGQKAPIERGHASIRHAGRLAPRTGLSTSDAVQINVACRASVGTTGNAVVRNASRGARRVRIASRTVVM